MEEVWKKIEGYDYPYEVSNLGIFKSPSIIVNCPNHIGKQRKLPERILKGCINNNGYIILYLTKNGKVTCKALHFFVLSTFGRPKKGNEVCNHIDSNKINNVISNLEWVSIKENVSHYQNTKKKSSRFNGVTWDKNRSLWKASSSLKENGRQKLYNLGRFINERSAALAVLNFNQERGIINKYFIAL